MTNARPNGEPGLFTLTVPNSRSGAQFLRRAFVAHLATCDVGPVALAEDVAVAVGEALANAAEHGYVPDGSISLTVEIAERVLLVEVADDGRGFGPRPRDLERDVEASRGFGIHIMRSMMDNIDFHDGGRRVVLKKLLPD